MHEVILIIDDKVQFSRSLGENLQDLGYRFRSATCAAEAIAELKTGEISLVLLDIVLGEEDGLSVLQRIRAAHPRLPVIMITGYASISTAVSSMKLGALDYIQKPVNFTVLSKLIDNALGAAAAPGSANRPPASRQTGGYGFRTAPPSLCLTRRVFRARCAFGRL